MNFHLFQGVTTRSSPLLIIGFVTAATFSSGTNQVTLAQIPPPVTPSGLNTQISTPIPVVGGKTQYNITGGTRPGDGVNLFHSFGEFGLPINNVANFLNDTALPSTNILGRVTGGNPSNIFGTIQTTGFGNANLFLMNPAGFLFGPEATVNVGGMVTFTSADYLRLTDNARFNAIPSPQDALLSTSPVATFGFLGTNPAAISVEGSTLTVVSGQTLSLVGGDIDLTEATLNAPGGKIQLASLASPGEIALANLASATNVNGQFFTKQGTIALAEESMLNVSSDAAGTVVIRGGKLMIENSTISADTVNANGASTAVDIQITGDLSISVELNPAITARTTGSGNAGQIRIASENTDVVAASEDILAVIDSHTSGSGRAGNVSITTGELSVTGDAVAGLTFFIDSGTVGEDGGHGGDVAITAHTIQSQDAPISTGNFLAEQALGEEANGSGGNVTISADKLELSFAPIITSASSLADRTGEAGNITITARDINLEASVLESAGFERGGAITINADKLIAVDSQIITNTQLMPGGAVVVTGNVVELTNGSSVVSSTGGNGHAGSITITATDHLGLLRATPTDRPSGIFSNSFGTFGNFGNAGDIFIATPRLEMTGGARINTSTRSSGRGGNVTINSTHSIAVSGETGGFSPEPLFSLGSIQPSGIFTLTIGGKCSGPCGNAGNVSLTTGSLIMGSGAQINSGTSSTGRGGDLAVNASGTISISGTLSNGQPAGMLSRTTGSTPESGQGGNISLTAGQSVSLSNGASVAADSTGPGNAGNILINAGQNYTSTNSSVTTQAAQASGGNITVLATDIVRLTNSQINASVQGSSTTIGGNIVIDPNFVILQNSQILAQATQGQGGNISITAGTFLADSTSTVSASSQFGLSGTVTIQSPISQLAGRLSALPKDTALVTSLLGQRCAAQANGQYSSFVLAGRETLPTEPGGWLASPLVITSSLTPTLSLEGNEMQSEMLSLRRMPFGGGVARVIPIDWMADCGS